MPDDAELVLPFTITRSHGGPHDDAAFAAGWRLATIAAELATMHEHDTCTELVLRTELPQLDLIAMHHGAHLRAGSDLGNGWVEAHLWKLSA